MTDAKGAPAPGIHNPSDKSQDGLLKQADTLLAMAWQAQQNGDMLASIDLAVKAQERLHLAKLLRESGDG